MLSAVVKCLPLIRKEPKKERRQMLVDVCVSAYPDLCPWQVKQALLETPGEDTSVSKGLEDELNDLYYYYLSSLLHPQDGHEAARNDRSLVKVCNHKLILRHVLVFFNISQALSFHRNGVFCH